MIKNRFFSQAGLGVAAEAIIAQALDTSAGAIAGSPATGTASVAVAATTTSGDQLVITTGPQTFNYASVGAVTAAAFGTALLAYLNAHAYSVANGIVWTKSGTTSLVLTATYPNGSQYNGIPFNIEAGPTNAGPSFSTFSSTNSTGGSNGTGGSQADVKSFVASAAAGAIAAYWNDTNLLVQPGDTSNAANAGRRFCYFWKQDDTLVTMRSSPVPVKPTYKIVAYNAGTADVWTIGFGGTYSVGQYLHIRILDTTSKTTPYPSYEYEQKITVDLATALAAIVVKINAEPSANGPVATATTSTTNVVITCNDKNLSLKVIAYVEVGPVTANATDASAITYTHTTPGVAPLGTFADMKEFEKAYLVKNAAILYVGDQGLNVNVADFQTQATNVKSNINYGFLVITAVKTETNQASVQRFTHKTYFVIAAPAAAINYLATL